MSSEFRLTPEIHKAFPTTRYQGSKRKLVPWIWEKLAELSFDSALDAFGGSGSVSYLLKKMGKRVIFNDLLRFNVFSAKALIENDFETLTDEDLRTLTASVECEPPGFVSEHFKGLYFTNRENLWIDTTVRRIDSLHKDGGWSECKRAIAMHSLFQTCISKRPFNLFHRANLSLRLADVERTFGNKTTWDKPFGQHLRKFVNETNASVFEGQQKCFAVEYDVEDLPSLNPDLVYLDPPYLRVDGENESADYRHCYHFLEGLARYHEWPNLINWNSRLKGISRRSNPWIVSGESSLAFEKIFEQFRDSIIVVSYKKYGVPSVDRLVRLLKSHGKRVRVHSRHYKYSLNHQNGSAKYNRECLIIAE